MKPKDLQRLVNAQVEVNRAVFEVQANKFPQRDEYLLVCLNRALTDLKEVRRYLVKKIGGERLRRERKKSLSRVYGFI